MRAETSRVTMAKKQAARTGRKSRYVYVEEAEEYKVKRVAEDAAPWPCTHT